MTGHEALYALDMTKKPDNFAIRKTLDKSPEINLNGALTLRLLMSYIYIYIWSS